jgi:S-phase kinase-associated protein 1
MADEKKDDKTDVPEDEVDGLDEEIDIELTLKSQDGVAIMIKKDVAVHSALIKTMWSGDKTETEIPLPNVRGMILKKVVEFMEYHHENPMKEIEKPLKSANMRDVVMEWDANFVEVDQETLFELILAANYMDIKPLLDLTCAKVASMLKGKTPEQIRKQFNIANDFTPEEEEAVRAENKWAEDS